MASHTHLSTPWTLHGPLALLPPPPLRRSHFSPNFPTRRRPAAPSHSLSAPAHTQPNPPFYQLPVLVLYRRRVGIVGGYSIRPVYYASPPPPPSPAPPPALYEDPAPRLLLDFKREGVQKLDKSHVICRTTPEFGSKCYRYSDGYCHREGAVVPRSTGGIDVRLAGWLDGMAFWSSYNM